MQEENEKNDAHMNEVTMGCIWIISILLPDKPEDFDLKETEIYIFNYKKNKWLRFQKLI